MMPRRITVIVALLTVVMLCVTAPSSAIDWKLFKDSEDGALDLSDWLMTKGGFMPVPIIVTEPAVGTGLGLATVFFHGKLIGRPNPNKPGQQLPPSMTVAAGAYTENGTWFAGGGHVGHWKQDRIRYTGFIGVMNLNIDFYAGNQPIAFNIDGGFMLQQIKFRLGKSNFFVGGKWIYFDSTATIDGLDEILPPEWPDLGLLDGFESTNSGLGVVGYFDGRDNVFTPGTGQEGELEITRYDHAIGGDFDYWYLHAKFLSFHKLHEKFALGLRFDGEAVDGNVPFYGYPFVQLRGVPAMRYQDQRVLNLEVEGRWQFYKRWSLVGFVGKGFTDGDIPRFDTDENIVTFGGGFRYLIARKFNMHVGVDVARGPEDTAF
ncbi:MAG: glyceraldehyde-3-phosphate dehydrogenase [Acidobacteriota bacterium]|nr:glyceraldehyde-3-phosphate dehydrogenase [Acidobacteriota bacterium]